MANIGIYLIKNKFSCHFFCVFCFLTYLCSMRNKLFFTALFMLLALTACEKGIESESTSTGGSTTAAGESISEDDKLTALTVAEALKEEPGTPVYMKGYIVAATQKSMNNMEYGKPFTASTALVLADYPSYEEMKAAFLSKYGEEYLDEDEADEAMTEFALFPVCLTDAGKGIRDAFNLKDHPEHLGRFVYLFGTLDWYMSMPGLKKVRSIEIDPNYVPQPRTDDDTAKSDDEDGNTGGDTDKDTDENTENGNNGSNSSTDDGENNSGNSGGNSGSGGSNSGNTSGTSTDYMTVAQAKQAKKNVKIKVRGYIVGAVMGGGDFGSIVCPSFEAPAFNDYKAGIILADKPFSKDISESEQFDLDNFNNLLFVSLNNSKPTKLKDELNLPDNPDNHNKRIEISGTAEGYIIGDGLKEITGYKFLDE